MGLILSEKHDQAGSWLDDDSKAAALDAHLAGLAPRYSAVEPAAASQGAAHLPEDAE